MFHLVQVNWMYRTSAVMVKHSAWKLRNQHSGKPLCQQQSLFEAARESFYIVWPASESKPRHSVIYNQALLSIPLYMLIFLLSNAVATAIQWYSREIDLYVERIKTTRGQKIALEQGSIRDLWLCLRCLIISCWRNVTWIDNDAEDLNSPSVPVI